MLVQTPNTSADVLASFTVLTQAWVNRGYTVTHGQQWPRELAATAGSSLWQLNLPSTPHAITVLLHKKWLSTARIVSQETIPMAQAQTVLVLPCPTTIAVKKQPAAAQKYAQHPHLLVATLPQKLAWEALGISAEKLSVCAPCYTATVTAQERQNTVCTTPIQSLQEAVLLLKAFSIFKKWQQTSYTLTLVIPDGSLQQQVAAQLQTYKYKTHVATSTQFTASVAASWLCIGWQIPQQHISLAYQCFAYGVPLVCACTQQAMIPTHWQNFVYAAEPTPEDIGKLLLQAYRNEEQHSTFTKLSKQYHEQVSTSSASAELASLLAI